MKIKYQKTLLLLLIALGSMILNFSCNRKYNLSFATTNSLKDSLQKEMEHLSKQEEQLLTTKKFSNVTAQVQSNTKAEADRLKEEGELQFISRQYPLALENLEQAMNIYKEIGDEANYQDVLRKVYLLYIQTGDEANLQRLRPEYEKLSTDSNDSYSNDIESVEELDSLSLMSFGLELVKIKDFSGGRDYFQQALSKAKEINSESQQISIQTEIGKSYLYEGDYDNAIATFRIVEELSNRRNPYIERGLAVNNDAQSESSEELWGEFMRDYLPFVELFGEAYLQNNQPTEALAYFEKVLEIVTQLDSQLYQGISPEEYQVAEELFGKSIFNSPMVVNDPNLNLSRANYSLGNYQIALEYAEKAISKAESVIKNPSSLYADRQLGIPSTGAGDGYGYALAGIAWEKLGQLEQAEENLTKAVQIFESTSNKSTFKGDIEHSLKLLNNQVRAASSLQRVLVAQNKTEDALAAAEWGRGKLLVEDATATKLSETSLEEKVDAYIEAEYGSRNLCQEKERLSPQANPIPQINIPTTEFQGGEVIYPAVDLVPQIDVPATKFQREKLIYPKSNSIKKQFSLTNKQHKLVAQCDNTAEIEEIRQVTLESARENPEEFERTFSTYSTIVTSLGIKSKAEPPNIEQLKQIAQSQQATIVEYSIISDTTFFHGSRQNNHSYNAFPGKEQKIFIWVIMPTGKVEFRKVNLATAKTPLEKLVLNTRNSIGVRGSFDFEPVNNIDINPQEQLKALHRLLIQPIAELLPTDENANVIFIPHEELFLVPFAALQDEQGKYLIEKNTIITSPSIHALELARSKQIQTSKNKKAVVVGNPAMPSIPQPNNQPAKQLNSLDGAKKEGEYVAKLLNTKLLTGHQATETEVVKQLSNAQYIHLATHGLLDDYAGFGIPGAIALAPSDSDDGFFTSSEIEELSLTAELAVLSACNTGRGNISGDGVVGLSRAFLISGVRSIVISLWLIPDTPTAFLMSEFYDNFNQGFGKAQALRKAMLGTKELYPEPKNWAAFTLIGEAE